MQHDTADQLAPTIIHFGEDQFLRLPVLRKAGYLVQKCLSIPEFKEYLSSNRTPCAIVMAEANASSMERAISLARSRTSAPVILFPGTRRTNLEARFDLIIPALTPPREWLLDLNNLIAWSGALRSEATITQEQAARLREECEKLRAHSRMERERSLQERYRMDQFLETQLWKTQLSVKEEQLSFC